MCYNCGCGKPDSDMGNPKNITNKTFEEAAKAAKQTSEEARRNAYEILKKGVRKEKVTFYSPCFSLFFGEDIRALEY